ncbi:phosphatase PAP2 family protein [Serpentinicella sp. ANB-PHB4]|uniref:phosphatase PAP2 family protein n=1 Tax=Serpentinicella sp. ANB-PHB4 TaxID=3074076 RepID=UPI00286775BF|nr:phosphatase PAP2 family protein [Serpentinicella sp. ANB-PHB4]MDR5659851.1 phosphatase PAP2 family protein [Serpentinicella sp. ANB-PHB4]
MKNNKVIKNTIYLLTLSVVILTVTVLKKESLILDSFFFEWMNAWSTPKLHAFMEQIVFLGSTEGLFILTVLTLLVLLRKYRFDLMVLYLSIMSCGLVVTYAMKKFIQRPRPAATVFVDFWGLGADSISYSFPSGHAMKSTLFFGFLTCCVYLHIKNKGIKASWIGIATIIVLSVGGGQMLNGRHFFTDIIAGYLVGLNLIFVNILLYGKYKEKVDHIMMQLPRKLPRKIRRNV